MQQEGITLVNVYIPNIRAPTSVKQIVIDTKGEFDRNSHNKGFYTPMTSMDRSSRQKN